MYGYAWVHVDTSCVELSDVSAMRSQRDSANHANPPSNLTMCRTPLEDRVYGGRPEDPALHRRCPHAHIVEGLETYARDILVR